jgi:gliding motility-associated-like protein
MKKIFGLVLLIIIGQNLLAQYTVNGNASQIACNEYRLTFASNGQSGSVWNNNKINLSQSFDFKFDVFLGNNDAGADGIAFVLQPISTSVGTTGGGLGYDGITPAAGVTIDTWQNTNDNDPSFDHIAIQVNGNLNHNTANNIAGPVTVLNGSNNIEDGNWHALRIQWDATTKTLLAYVDGNLRVSAVKDFVTDVFAGDPLVFWGFTGSTGGANNEQRFRTALNPAFHLSPTQKRCINDPITFYDSTVSFTSIAKFYWNFGDGSPLDSVNINPIHTYVAAGNYTVKQRVIGADGCEATNTQIILIGSKPIAGFTTDDNCIANTIHFTDISSAAFGTVNNWYWDFDNNTTAAVQFPATTYITGGNKNVKLVVKSLEGCESDTLVKLLHIYTRPVLDFTFTDSVCLGLPTNFLGAVISSDGPVTNWVWNFGDTTALDNTQNTTHQFIYPGIHPVLFAATSNGSAGCMGLIQKNVFVVNKPTAYFKYNTICQSASTTFTDSSYTSDAVPVNQWWWNVNGGVISTLNNINTKYANAGNDTIKLLVHNSKGCASDTLKQPIVINVKPAANFGFSSLLCNNLPVQFSDSSVVTGGLVNKWSWIYNNAVWSTLQNPNRTFTPGLQTIKLAATSAIGCISDTAVKTFFVNPNPNVAINFNDACKNTAVNFIATDNSGTVTQWKWTFGDGGIAVTQNAQHIYTSNGTYKVKLFAAASNGCYPDSLNGNIVIYGTNAFAGNDTIAAAGQPVQLNASGGLSYTWSPATLLSNAAIANPFATLLATQTFTVKAFTPEGCESFDDVTVKIYKGPDIYLPNAFTPNGDGVNDVFKGIPVGLKQFNYLKIYNRWGQLVFAATDYRKGWDGLWQGQKQPGAAYIVIANGIDFNNNVIDKKQSFILIR